MCGDVEMQLHRPLGPWDLWGHELGWDLGALNSRLGSDPVVACRRSRWTIYFAPLSNSMSGDWVLTVTTAVPWGRADWVQ